MKKTLVALAVLAASGASFADVKITGTAGYGYKQSTGPASSGTTGGFGVSDSGINFASSEDLGGGNSVSASFGIDNTTRAGIGGADFDLAISGGWGTLDMSLAEGSDFLSGDFVGLDGKVFSGLGPATDSVAYITPELAPGLKLSFVHGEDDNAIGAGAAGTLYNKQRLNQVGVSYKAGKLAVSGAYRNYENSDVTGNAKNQSRVKASYDFGSFKVGAGIVDRAYNNTASDRIDTNLGVSTSFGQLAVAADIGTRKTNADQTKSGYGVTAYYSLSARTSVGAEYYNWQNNAGEDRSTVSLVKLKHSF